jgi:23S rRNA pseudouridine1911/1915/1917 synthase
LSLEHNVCMNYEEKVSVTVLEEYAGERVDRFLTAMLEEHLSRSFLKKLIAKEHVTIDGRPVKASYKCKVDEEITLFFPEPEHTDLEPWDHPLDIIHSDDYITVLNKEPGLVVHPGAGNRDETLVNALLYFYPDLPVIGGEYRPGIVHRLDRDTAGIMVTARTNGAHEKLTAAFAQRKVKKNYYALVSGKREIKGEIDLPIGRHPKYGQKMTIRDDGRNARTGYKTITQWNSDGEVFSLLDVTLYTGRTHQIRVHLSSTGTPIVGDPIYSKRWKKYKVPFLLLQSYFLGFEHPYSGEFATYRAPMAPHIQAYVNKLNTRAEIIYSCE